MRIKNGTIKNMLFYIIVLGTSFVVYTVDGIYSAPKVLISNMLIIIITLIFMIRGDKYNYSLNKIFMLFSFFFYGIAPVFQYQHGRTFWHGMPFDDQSYFRMNIIIIVTLLLYQWLYYIFSKLKSSNISYKKQMIKEKNLLLFKKNLFVLALFSMVITLYYNNFNLENLLFRAGGDMGRVSLTQSTALVYSNFIRPIPIVALVLFKTHKIKDKRMEIVLLIISLITNFPTSRARFYIAAIYIPLVIIYIKQFHSKYLLLNKAILIGMLIVFPFLEQARRFSQLSDFKLGLDFQMFLEGHFDSFQMFMRVVDENFITMGSQLLSSVLFFMPRSIWPDKSVGSGALLANELGLSFDNISMNYFGEGYINFGYFGIFIFTVIIAFTNAKLDKMYWRNMYKINFMSPYYLFQLGLIFFILRGDLLSSVAFTIGLLSSIYFVHKIATRKKKKVRNHEI